MKKKPKAKMDRGQRAKQFLPYDALDGWDDEILQMEEEQEREQARKELGHGPKLEE